MEYFVMFTIGRDKCNMYLNSEKQWSLTSLSRQYRSDFLPFGHHKRIVDVPTGLNAGENLNSLIDPSDLCQPARRPG